MNHYAAWNIAESLAAHLRPACERIEIKGSLCRMKPEVRDIDLLVIPDLTQAPKPKLSFIMTTKPKIYRTMLDKLIGEMVDDGTITMEKGGQFSKRFYLKYAGISAEIYTVLPPATWGVRSVIRTGPADFSHWVVTRKRNGGALPDGYRVQDGGVYEGADPVTVEELRDQVCLGFEEETDFLNWLGLGWIEPKDRSAKWTG